ncbi:MAG TPA: sigma-70 family RNA polymerase sigma factor [Acidobacteriota bacterium]|nr:sigma-70 family RNA polymerase sigma factor [Acidobacteriota bacterium]
MSGARTTCWTMIRGAARGGEEERTQFSRLYAPVIRAYLAARWRSNPALIQDLEDAVQETMLECFREGGALSRASSRYRSGFRAFLFGIVRNVARRQETRAVRRREVQPTTGRDLQDEARHDPTPSKIFEREWARSLMRQAALRQQKTASDEGALKRVELLRLRFGSDLPIREIARLWECEAAWLHHEYAKARREFHRSLLEVLEENGVEDPSQAEKECARLIGLLS